MVSAVRLRFLSGKKLDDWQHSFKPKRYRLKGTVNASCMPRGWASGAILRDRYEAARPRPRSEEHTSELQSLMRISYAVFCLKKKHTQTHRRNHNHQSKIR